MGQKAESGKMKADALSGKQAAITAFRSQLSAFGQLL
jgi:hypothetical protein